MIDEDLGGMDTLNGPFRFANRFDVNLTTDTDGQWDNVDGLEVWRLKITSRDAYGIMLIIDSLHITEHASLFVYSSDTAFVEGPFTYLYNDHSVINIPLIPGGEIIVELVYDVALVQEIPGLRITRVYHDYWNVTAALYTMLDEWEVVNYFLVILTSTARKLKNGKLKSKL